MNYRCLLFILCLSVVGAEGSGAQPRPSSLQYVSPIPGAILVSRESNVIVRLEGGLSRYTVDLATMFSAVGSHSGRHFGTTIVSDDGETIVFEPNAPFEPGEDVTITLRYRDVQRTGETESFEFRFTVSPTRRLPPSGSSCPVSILNKVDLPTFGRPTMTTTGFCISIQFLIKVYLGDSRACCTLLDHNFNRRR